MNRKWSSCAIAGLCALGLMATLPANAAGTDAIGTSSSSSASSGSGSSSRASSRSNSSSSSSSSLTDDPSFITTESASPVAGDHHGAPTADHGGGALLQFVLATLFATMIGSALTFIGALVWLPNLVEHFMKKNGMNRPAPPAPYPEPPATGMPMIEGDVRELQRRFDMMARRVELLERLEDRPQSKPAPPSTRPDDRASGYRPEPANSPATSQLGPFGAPERRLDAGGARTSPIASPPSPAYNPPSPAPAPAPAPSPGSPIDLILSAYRALLTNQALTSQEFDRVLGQYGELMDVVHTSTGHLATGPYTSGSPSRRLVGLRLNNNRLLLFPSSYFVKDFAMQFREVLEAGADIKEVFATDVDGTGRLRYSDVATARMDSSGHLVDIHRGRLSGFSR